ncbi:hypothetical protein OHB56_40890 [Streptomyces sp. NBC_01635]|uniref:hypothetical protein n=1 Tax=Streptomyces sp. NBC_01635 TaxID=2975904 RepID=UPI00386BF578|nr:hypothetical protein OHB56_00025 [Streptomyces sp. NBC_01635]WTD79583.1 hypothetical protein OHB56_40890 [Streptomyces sp. NBC_01635]
MSARKAPEGPYSYPTHPTWVEHFYEAITNTCKDKGFAPLPRQAVLDGLAPALGQSEAKRVIERRRAGRFLREAACHVEQPDTDAALLLLRVDLHGAATLPWATNDRTRSDWLHPSADNLEGLEELVDQQQMVAAWTVGVERTKTALRMLAPTAAEAEKDAAEAAVKIAEDELARARQELKACEQALGGRRPLPVVRAVTEDGVALAALTAEKARTDVAAEVQRYAVDKLRQRARQRPYDLAESLVQEGQRDSTVVVLQRTPVVDRDGSRRDIWRGQQATGANRADARLAVFGLSAQQLLTGVPQSLLRLPGEEENRRLVVRGLGEILRRISILLNTECAAPERDLEGRAERARRIAQVPARVVVGARRPERLEESLRQLNVHEHLRGQLDYDDMDRALGLWSTLVKAYQAKGLLGELLAQEVAQGRVAAGKLDEDAIADALVGARALDELKVLLPPGDQVSPLTLRDVAIRCATVMVFPPVPPRPQELAPRAPMPTGRYWPVVRTVLQEAAWAQRNAAKAERRSEMWAAVVAQHFVHRGPLAAAEGLFGKLDVQFGVRPDARSLASLLTACRQGDATAWETLVRRHLVPGMISAAKPFITPNQGSLKGEDRKGVRRAPSNAVQALVNAYTDPPEGVTRELLVAFAEAVLHAPESPTAGDLPAGAFWAPDAHGKPREGVLADKQWFDTLFPLTSFRRNKVKQQPSNDITGTEAEDSSGATVELEEEIPEPPHVRMMRLRAELASTVASNTVSVTAVAQQIVQLLMTVQEAVRAREEAGEEKESAEVRALYVEDFNKIKKEAGKIATKLDEATLAVMSL